MSEDPKPREREYKRRSKPQPSYLLPVQLNVTVPYSYREYLQTVARDNHVSLAELVRQALRARYPHHISYPSQKLRLDLDPKDHGSSDDSPDRDDLEWT